MRASRRGFLGALFGAAAVGAVKAVGLTSKPVARFIIQRKFVFRRLPRDIQATMMELAMRDIQREEDLKIFAAIDTAIGR